MARVCRLLVPLAVCAVLTGPLVPAAHGAGAIGGGPSELSPARTDALIAAGSARVIRFANRAPEVAAVRRKQKLMVAANPLGGTKWAARYAPPGGEAVLEVDVDLATGAIDRVWTGDQVNFPMARGYRGWFGGHVTAPYVWLPLSAIFLALFFDLRRPWRRAHLDLLAVPAFGVSQWFFQRGQIDASVVLSYVPLLYLLARMISLGRPGRKRDRLRPSLGLPWLVAVLVALCVFRIAFNLLDTNDHEYVGWGLAGTTVVDVGYAGVVGADRLQQGLPLYAEGAHLDTYGPLNYVAYVPFERLFPFTGKWDSLPAAHLAAISFDLATILGLILLGMRLRSGREGRLLGVALACAWAACPYSTYVLNANTNDAIVAASLVWALVFFKSSFLRGVVAGLGMAAKLVPAALLPVLLRFRGERGWRPAAITVAGFALVVSAFAVAFAPAGGGVGLLWRHTVARQSGSPSPFSIWGMWPSIDWLRTLLELLLLLGTAAIALGRDRGVVQAAALGAALIIGVELTSLHWIYFYVVWFLPLVLVTLIAPDGDRAMEVARS